ncbi:MAG TPA: aspartate--ammonia ligase [Firmicutes bacterium]|nr:aspartate--ammonia ligase [Bacillota bacterium]
MNVLETQVAIKIAREEFEKRLARNLNLLRVSAPLFVRPESGLNDNLNGVERPVQFDVKDIHADVQVVQSLAKWKRLALKRYGIQPGQGLYTDMNAIRRDEELDNLHSVYVDQWDWEKVIHREDRTFQTLHDTVEGVVDALKETQRILCREYSALTPFLDREVTYLTSQELEDRWPQLTPKQREDAAAKEYGLIFISQIGGKLRSGKPHDGRAPDYDDWELNGDILVWYPVLDRAVELSSMGIRVSPESLARQLELAGCPERAQLEFHRALLAGELPYTIGGGIGQSRVCMVLLEKAHVGEVQVSVWPQEMISTCDANGIHLL